MVKIREGLRQFHQLSHYPQEIESTRLRLDRNEFPYPPSELVQERIVQEFPNLSRYPENTALKLREALSLEWGLSPNHFLIGNGSFELLSLISQVFLDETSQVILPSGSFIWQEKFSRFSSAEIKKVSLKKDLHIDLEEIARLVNEQTTLIWLTNPNNPTGKKLAEKDLTSFVESLPEKVLLVIDQAYIEFVEEDSYSLYADYIKKFSNVILLRTFSKFYRLASLRIGYAVANEQLIASLLPYRIPPNHSRLATVAAIASLGDNDSHRKTRQYLVNERNYLTEQLNKLGFEVVPSHANFLFVSIGKHPQTIIDLLAKKVLFKKGSFFGFPDYFRITIGTKEENRELIKIAENIINGEL